MASGWHWWGERDTAAECGESNTAVKWGRATPWSGGRRAEWLLGGTGGGRGTLLLSRATSGQLLGGGRGTLLLGGTTGGATGGGGGGGGPSSGIGGGRGKTSSFSYQLLSGGGTFMGLVLTIDDNKCGRTVDVDVGAVV